MSAASDGTEPAEFSGQSLLLWLFYWLPPLLWMAIIFYLSAQPDLPHAPDARLDALLKKTGHATEYALLFLLLLRAWQRHRGVDTALCRSLWTTGAYAVSDELHQALVPGRYSSGYDVLIDVSGVLLLVWLLRTGRWRGFVRSQDQDLAE